MSELRGIVPQYLMPGVSIPFRKGKKAERTEVLTNPTPEQEAAAIMPIRGMKTGLFGFGSQSSNHARCLRQEDADITIIGRDPGSASMKAAAAEGFRVVGVHDIPKLSILGFGLPDDQQVRQIPAILRSLPNRPTLMFYHGMSVHYGLRGFYGPDLRDALIGWNIAGTMPKGPGTTVWRNKSGGGGTAILYGAADTSPQRDDTLTLAKAYCAALGGYRGAMLQTTFDEETETDHFGEQGVLCGVLLEAYLFMISRLQKYFGMPLQEAQSIVERELVLFGDAIRRGGAAYVLQTASREAVTRMKVFASQFYKTDLTHDSNFMDEELENVGARLRALQPHLSPVLPSGTQVCGEPLEKPESIRFGNMGGISGILLVASTLQYRIGRAAGYTAEGLQFEVQQEIPLITDCIRFGGMAYMALRISTTAKHGMFVSGRYIAESRLDLHSRFGTLLGAIQDGSYAKRTKLDLVDVERGSEADWLWRATKAVIGSPEQAASDACRLPKVLDFKGGRHPAVFVRLGQMPWEYYFCNSAGNVIQA